MSDVAIPEAHVALPASWYADEAQAERERREIFRRTWQLAGLAGDVSDPGSYLTADIGGVPVVVTRDQDGVLHGLVNVCPHRGMIIAAGTGSAKLLQCPNHAWSFGLDGRLRAAPRSDMEPRFACEGLDLRPVAVCQWGPFVLANLDAAASPPTAELVRMRESIEQYGLDFDALVPHAAPVDWEIAANWKIVCENYLECYHCAVVHPGFSQVFDVRGDRFALEDRGELLSAFGPVRATRDPQRQQAILDTRGPVADSHWHLLFPAMTINVYPGAGAVEATWYWPHDAHRTGGRTVVLLAPDASPAYARQVLDLSLQVCEEDNVLCEGLHRGLTCGALERPALMEVNERLVVRFQELVRGYLSAP